LAAKKPAPEAEIDVDDLDDAAFAELKGQMAADADAEAPQEEESAADEPKAAETDEPAPEPTEAKTDEEDGDDEPEGKKSETVPHGQYHRERERRKAAEAERQQLADNYNKLLERTQQLLEVQRAPEADAEAEDAAPPRDDPVAAINWLVEKYQKGEISRAEAEQAAEQQRQWQDFGQRVKAGEEAFRQQAPDFDDAIRFAQDSRDRELQVLYPLSTPQDRYQYIQQEWQHLAQQSLQAGRNPAEQVYEFAKLRGYSAPQPDPEPANDPDPVAKIAAREDARKASMSLGKAGGGVASTGAVSPEQLLDMSDEEFAAYKAKNGSVARAFAN
jgi:hypothetical protein